MLRILGKKLTVSLLSLVILMGLLPTTVLAIGEEPALLADAPITVGEYHLMNKSAFQGYYHDKIKASNSSAWGIVLNGIRIYATDGRHTFRSANPGTNYFNVYNHVEGGTGTIQPEDISHIVLYGTYAWGSNSVTLSRDEFDVIPHPAQSTTQAFAEIYLDKDAPEPPQVVTHDVIFDLGYVPANGSPQTATQVVTDKELAKPPAAPERDGFTFGGWCAENSKTPFNFTTPITAPITLTANWEVKYAAWFFVRTDGLVPMEDGDTSYPGNQYLPAHAQGTQLTGTITQPSAWTTHYGTLDGDMLNGVQLSAAFATVRTAIAEFPTPEALAAAIPPESYNPEKQGIIWYVVKAIDGGNTACPGYHVDGIVYTKGQDPAQLRVLSYFSNIPENNELLAHSVHGLGTKATVGNLIPTRIGYEFVGWRTTSDGTTDLLHYGAPLKMDTDLALYAQWKLKTYNVTYSWTGAPETQTIPATASVDHGESYTVDTSFTSNTKISANGGTYTFSDWSETGVLSNITAPVTLTGTWTFTKDPPATTYGVTYQYTGSVPPNMTPFADSGKYEAGALATLAPAPSAPANYTFKGWVLPEGLTLADGTFAMPTDNVLILGEWSYTAPPASTYGVTYQYTGSVPPNMTPFADSGKYEASALATLAPAPIAPANYTFNGWVLPDDLTLTDGTFTMPTGNVAIVGEWSYTAPSGGGGDSTPSRYTVTVNYLELDTNAVLAAPYASGRIISGSSYDVSAQAALPISDYTLASVDGVTSGTLRRNITVNVYYTADQDIPEEETPLTPGPGTGDNNGGEIDIPGEEAPLAHLPDTSESTSPDTEDDTIIVEEDVPRGNLPQTGTAAHDVDPTITLGLMALVASLAAAGLGIALGRKKEEEV